MKNNDFATSDTPIEFLDDKEVERIFDGFQAEFNDWEINKLFDTSDKTNPGLFTGIDDNEQ